MKGQPHSPLPMGIQQVLSRVSMPGHVPPSLIHCKSYANIYLYIICKVPQSRVHGAQCRIVTNSAIILLLAPPHGLPLCGWLQVVDDTRALAKETNRSFKPEVCSLLVYCTCKPNYALFRYNKWFIVMHVICDLLHMIHTSTH